VTAPDLSEARQHAEAVAYGKLLAVREILDTLAKERPSYNPGFVDDDPADLLDDAHLRIAVEGVSGYDRAVRVVKAMRLGVDK
jgi:hypothetical protein